MANAGFGSDLGKQNYEEMEQMHDGKGKQRNST